jgi:uncharacterized protein YkwD
MLNQSKTAQSAARFRYARLLTALLAIGVVGSAIVPATSSVASTAISGPSRSSKRSAKKRPKPAPANPTSNVAANQLEQEAHDQINRYRASKGLSPLKWSDAIAQQARLHSSNMATGRTNFSHDGFSDRVQGSGLTYRGAAENVAYNQGYSKPVDEAVKGWIDSPGHRQNMEGNYDTAGIGIAQNAKGEYYFTQVFMKTQ